MKLNSFSCSLFTSFLFIHLFLLWKHWKLLLWRTLKESGICCSPDKRPLRFQLPALLCQSSGAWPLIYLFIYGMFLLCKGQREGSSCQQQDRLNEWSVHLQSAPVRGDAFEQRLLQTCQAAAQLGPLECHLDIAPLLATYQNVANTLVGTCVAVRIESWLVVERSLNFPSLRQGTSPGVMLFQWRCTEAKLQ